MDTPGRIAELERKFEENPRRYFAALANEYRKSGQIDRAIELCERHLSEQRNHLSGHVVLAQALVDAGRDSDAWDPLHTALDLDPENFIALRLLGDLSARAGEADQARGYFFRALEIEPRNDQVLDALKSLTPRQPEESVARAPVAPKAAGPREPGLAEAAEAAAEPVAEPLPLEQDMWRDLEPVSEPRDAAPPPVSEPKPAEHPLDQDMWRDLQPLPESEPSPVAETEPAELPWAHAGDGTAARSESEWAEQPAEAEPVTAGEEVWGGWDLQIETAETAQPAETTDVAQPEEAVMADVELEEAVTADVEPEEAVTADVELEDAVASDVQPYEAVAGADSVTERDFFFPDDELAVAPAGEPPLEEGGAVQRDSEEQVESRPTLVSETMVELYLAQGHVTFAVEALRDLVASRPEDERLRARLEELERSTAPAPKETVRDLFARLGRGRSRTAEAATALAEAFTHSAPEPGPIARFFGGRAAPDPGEDRAIGALLDEGQTDIPDAAAFENWLRELRGP